MNPITMTSEEWLGALANAWELGHLSICRRHGTMPFEACHNPYRITPTAPEANQ